MADRNSAEIFGTIFNRLMEIYKSSSTSGDVKQFIWDFSEELYKMTKNYDFATYQMDCEKAIDIFDLAELDEELDGSLTGPAHPDEDMDDEVSSLEDISKINFIAR